MPRITPTLGLTEAELSAVEAADSFATVLSYSTKTELESLLRHGLRVANDQEGVSEFRNRWKDINRLIRKQIKRF